MTEQQSEEDIEIPDNMFVSCPLQPDYTPVRILTECTQCSYFNGFYGRRVTGKQKIPFKKRFSVKCGSPVSRDIIEVKLR
jgi:hypothetical protein